MSEQMPAQEPLPPTAIVNGAELALASMSYAELSQMHFDHMDRAQAAMTDADTVARYMDDRYPYGPEEVA